MERAIVHNTITARHRLSPVIQCCEDVAYKTGLLISPDVLHQHFFPRFRRVIEPLKAAGIKVIWHSDGDIRAVLDDAISIGIDGIDPLERTAGMDVGSIRRKYGKRLILVGDVDSHVLKSGTEDEVRRTVRECIKAGDADGGHLVQSDAGQIMPDVPVRNVLAYIEEVKKFRVERKS